MKFTLEQVIEMAREADEGFHNLEGDMADAVCGITAITRLCTLAASKALEAAAGACEQTDEEGQGPDSWGWHAKDYAKTIRAIKEDN